MKKIVSMLLCLVMMMSLCTVVFATGTGTGTGTGGDKEYVSVYFDADGGSDVDMIPVVVKYVATAEAYQFTVTMPESTKIDYTLTGWSFKGETYKAGEKINFSLQNATDFDYTVEGGKTITLKAIWKQNEVQPKTYTVTYAKGDTTVVDVVATDLPIDNNKYVATDDVTIQDIDKHAKETAEAAGYKFAGWAGYVDLEGNSRDVVKAGDKLNINQNITLTPVWSKVVKTYSVIYVAGDTGADKNGMPKDETKYESGVMVVIKKMPATAIPEGYTFDGWTDGARIYAPGTRVVMLDSDLVLMPVLTKKSTPVTPTPPTRPTTPTRRGTTTTTTTTTISPKTGDMGIVLYAATALLSLSGTAVVINKRKEHK